MQVLEKFVRMLWKPAKITLRHSSLVYPATFLFSSLLIIDQIEVKRTASTCALHMTTMHVCVLKLAGTGSATEPPDMVTHQCGMQ